MTRSERLAREGKIEVYIGSLETAKVISFEELQCKDLLRYIGTDYEARYDGRKVQADVYDDEWNNVLYAVIG